MIPFPVLFSGPGFSLDAFMASQTDGLYYDTTQLDRFFQGTTSGNPLADDIGEAIGLALDQRTWQGATLSAYAYSQPELANVATQTLNNATGSQSNGGWNITATGDFAGVRQGFNVAVGDVIRIDFEWSGNDEGNNIYAVFGTWNVFTGSTAASGSATLFMVATAANTNGVQVFASPTTAGETIFFKINSIKRIAGNHGVQLTGGNRPLRQTAGAKFDGSDDSWLTTLLAGSGANFIVARVSVPSTLSGTQVIAGVYGGASDYGFLGVAITGELRYGAGATLETVPESGDLRDQEVVIGVSIQGTIARVMLPNGSTIDKTISGSVNTNLAFRVGAMNTLGTAANHFAGGVKKLAVGREFLTPTKFQQIRNAMLAA
jgi:hypothetical protein